MTEVTPDAPENVSGHTSSGDVNGAAHAPVNGTATSADSAAALTGTAKADTVKRAEALADRLALQVGVASTMFAAGFKRFVARVREEAEDLWAEAQHVRKGTKP